MALDMGQLSVPATTATAVLRLPAGQYDLTISCTAAALVYLGTGSGVSATNGFPVPTVPVRWNGYQASGVATLYAYGTAASTFNYVLSTQQG